MNLKYTVAAIGSGAIIVWLVLSLSVTTPSHQSAETLEESSSVPEQIQTTNGIRHIIPLDEIKSGGPPKDGIPSIDNPEFMDAYEAEFVSDDDIVIGLNVNGQARAYPLFILVWHEIVNDNVGGVPLAITYCPLCYTSQVFERTVDGKETEFGTSGKLYNSNLVMYDRNTDSMWSQAMGKAVVGQLTGYELKKIPFDLAKWSDWKKLYPDTVVLSTNTGHSRPYGSDPYGGYYTDSQIYFPVKNSDDRMHPKEIILGFEHNESFKAYKMTDIKSQGIINDNVGGQNLVLVSITPQAARVFDRTVDGQTLEFTLDEDIMIDKQTGTQWNIEGVGISGPLQGRHLDRLAFSPGFWFEWVAFHPTTEVY